MEHPVARELRFIRVCLIILIIVIAFWDREKTVESNLNCLFFINYIQKVG